MTCWLSDSKGLEELKERMRYLTTIDKVVLTPECIDDIKGILEYIDELEHSDGSARDKKIIKDLRRYNDKLNNQRLMAETREISYNMRLQDYRGVLKEAARFVRVCKDKNYANNYEYTLNEKDIDRLLDLLESRVRL